MASASPDHRIELEQLIADHRDACELWSTRLAGVRVVGSSACTVVHSQNWRIYPTEQAPPIPLAQCPAPDRCCCRYDAVVVPLLS